jgi:hypothetical protein
MTLLTQREAASLGEAHEVEASIGNDRSRVANDATAISTVASSEEPAPTPRSPVGVTDGSAPGITVEPSVRSNFRRRI